MGIWGQTAAIVREDSKYKIQKSGMSEVCVKAGKASVTGVQRVRGRIMQDEVLEFLWCKGLKAWVSILTAVKRGRDVIC